MRERNGKKGNTICWSLTSDTAGINVRQQMHTSLNAFPLSPFIRVWNHTVLTHWLCPVAFASSAIASAGKTCVVADHRQSEVLKQSAFHQPLGRWAALPVPPSFTCHSPWQHVGQLTCTFMASFPFGVNDSKLYVDAYSCKSCCKNSHCIASQSCIVAKVVDWTH